MQAERASSGPWRGEPEGTATECVPISTPAGRAALLESRGASFRFPAERAARYATTPTRPAGPSCAAGDVRIADGRLDRAAEILLAIEEDRGALSGVAATAALRWLGVPESPVAVAALARASEEDAVAAARAWLDARVRLSGARLRCGWAWARREGGFQITALSVPAALDIEPLPTVARVGDSLEIVGTVALPNARIQVATTDPSGRGAEIPVRGAGASFEARFTPNLPGRWQVEINLHTERGPTTVANFPVSVGGPFCETLELPRYALESKHPSELEELLVEAVKAERRSVGLPSVEATEALGAIARAYSYEMAETGVVAHVSPVSGTVMDRARASGLRPVGVTENLAVAHSAAEAHAGLMGSPAHRANILQPEAVRLGVGVRLVERPEGDLVYVTQVFELEPAPLKVEEVERELVAAVPRAAGRDLGRHPDLDAAAQTATAGCFGGASEGLDLSETPFSGAKLLVLESNDAAALRQAVERAIEERHSGFGLAARGGDDPGGAGRIVCLVFVLGER